MKDKNLVTETAYQLFDAAEGDALLANSSLKDKEAKFVQGDKICCSLTVKIHLRELS
jgi:hypothetical protein